MTVAGDRRVTTTVVVGRSASAIAIAALRDRDRGDQGAVAPPDLPCWAISTACTPAATDASVIAASRVAGITPGVGPRRRSPPARHAAHSGSSGSQRAVLAAPAERVIAGRVGSTTSYWLIMSWSSCTRLWQCIMYLPQPVEAHDHAHRLVLAEVGDVLRALLVGEWRLAVAVEDLEVDQVDVQRVLPAARPVDELPDLDAVPCTGAPRTCVKLLATMSSQVCPLIVQRPCLRSARDAAWRPTATAAGSSPGCPGRAPRASRCWTGRTPRPMTSNAMILSMFGIADVVLRVRVLQDDPGARLVLREVDHDLVPLGHDVAHLLDRLRVRHQAAVRADHGERRRPSRGSTRRPATPSRSGSGTGTCGASPSSAGHGTPLTRITSPYMPEWSFVVEQELAGLREHRGRR